MSSPSVVKLYLRGELAAARTLWKRGLHKAPSESQPARHRRPPYTRGPKRLRLALRRTLRLFPCLVYSIDTSPCLAYCGPIVLGYFDGGDA